MKKIPIKNYMLVIAISVITVLLVFYLIGIYNKGNKLDFITEVKEKKLSQYVIENNNIYIYFSKGNNKELEKNFEQYLINNEVKSNLIYVDLNSTSKDFNSKFNNDFIEVTSSIRIELKNPSLVYLENGKVIDFTTDIQTIDDIKYFIERNNND